MEVSDPYRTLAGYHWETYTAPIAMSGLELESLALGTPAPQRPMPIDVTLRWRKTGGGADLAPRLRLAQAGRVWSEIGSGLLERDYPIERWANGETVIDRLQIDYPPVRGPLDLQIGQGDQWITLTTLQLDESQIMFDPPQMQHAQAAQFGDFAGLLGYDLKSDSLSLCTPAECAAVLARDKYRTDHDAVHGLHADPRARWAPGGAARCAAQSADRQCGCRVRS